MSLDLDQLAEDASRRVAAFVNRSAGQHIRAMGINHQPAAIAQPQRDFSPTPHEAGNVWFVGDEPVPLTPLETFLIYTSMAIFCVISVALVVLELDGLYRWLR